MNDENIDQPRVIGSSRREFHHLRARHAAEFNAMRRESHVPQIPSIDTRAKFVGLHPPVASEASGDHPSANIVIYIPDNGRDSCIGSEPLG